MSRAHKTLAKVRERTPMVCVFTAFLVLLLAFTQVSIQQQQQQFPYFAIQYTCNLHAETWTMLGNCIQ